MPSFNTIANPGSFIRATDVYDTQVIYGLDIKSQDFKEFLVRLRQSINDISLELNTKESGFYVQEEFVNGNIWFPIVTASAAATDNEIPMRQEFTKVVNFGVLPNTASTSIAHGIPGVDGNFTFTSIYGGSADPIAVQFIPLSNPTISILVDATFVTITTTANLNAFTRTYVILKYVKTS